MPNISRISSANGRNTKISQTKFIRILCVSILSAIILAKFYPFAHSLSLPTYLPLVFFIVTPLIYKKSSTFARDLVLISVPVYVFISSSNLVSGLEVYSNLYDSDAVIIGTVQDDAAYNNYSDYEFNITKIKFAEDGEELKGRIRVRTKQNISLYRGDRVLVEGRVQPALGPRTASISYAGVSLVNSDPSWLEQLRLKFFSAIYTTLPEPHASLGIGFIAGVRSSIPKEFQDKLSRVGLTHIIAVSGYNLTILVLAIGKLGKKLSKYQKFSISLLVIMTFLLATGFSPSIVRASVVSLISLACTFFGRKISPLNLILIAAALTAGVNPTYIWEDIGWWLSFLAFFGVLILAPAMSSILFRRRSEDPGLIASVMIESFSAQIMTAPIIAHIFGTFSVISLFANILVIPFVPIVMLLVFLVGVIGISSSSLAALLAFMPRVLLTIVILIIDFFSNLRWASVGARISQITTLLLYIIILLFTFISSNRISSNESSKKEQPLISE